MVDDDALDKVITRIGERRKRERGRQTRESDNAKGAIGHLRQRTLRPLGASRNLGAKSRTQPWTGGGTSEHGFLQKKIPASVWREFKQTWAEGGSACETELGWMDDVDGRGRRRLSDYLGREKRRMGGRLRMTSSSCRCAFLLEHSRGRRVLQSPDSTKINALT